MTSEELRFQERMTRFIKNHDKPGAAAHVSLRNMARCGPDSREGNP